MCYNNLESVKLIDLWSIIAIRVFRPDHLPICTYLTIIWAMALSPCFEDLKREHHFIHRQFVLACLFFRSRQRIDDGIECKTLQFFSLTSFLLDSWKWQIGLGVPKANFDRVCYTYYIVIYILFSIYLVQYSVWVWVTEIK